MSLSNASFEYVRSILRERSAHNLEEDKTYLVETRLLAVARRHDFPSVEALILRMRSRRNEKLLAELVEAMTINETLFFRDSQPFEIIRQAVLPELVRLRSELRSLNIWSAACASGQEVYSIAILLRHYFLGLAGWNIHLFGSDLSTTMLERARLGRYTELEVGRGLSLELLHAYFRKQSGGWQISNDLRRMVQFQAINLSGPWPDLPLMDLILLRNVLIYFDVDTKRQILERVRRVLQPDGYLLLGGAESTYNLDDRFTPISFEGVSFFQVRRPESIM
jgi:chemotaxis protein methyltransferase CheR